ncbi:MAG: hypothetical protein JST21_15435, partial [Bacteroidetes bacterium]|nr:hypothetical protein [Bacteroidota bacterium]
MKTLFTLIAAISLMHTLSAQPGTLDKSFGDNGKVISETYQGLAYASLLQQDGKIVVGGSGTYYKNGKLLKGSLLARYNTDGSPDLSFADSGRGVYILGDTGSWVPTIRAMALQPDGKIIALGNFAVQNGVFAPFSLMRFNSDGSPDKSFGINGLTIGYISGGLDAPNDVALLSDDRIVIAGDLHKDINDVGRSFIACYTTNGVLDQSFGNGGIVTIAFAIDQLLTINAIAITKDDKIIVGGEYGFGANNTLLRYNNDGTQDLSFGENGLAQIFFDKKFSSVILNDIAISEDDNIITTGEVYFNSPKIAIEANRFNKIGKPDSSFGTNGYTYTEYSKGNSYGNCIAIQQNGKIIAAGYQAQGDSGTFTMVRYETDGSIDASFGEDGIQNTFFYGEDIAYAASIQNDGKIILVGSSQLETTSTVDIARYNNDGTQTPKQVIFAKIRRWWQHHNGIMWNNVPGIKNYAIQRSGDGAHWSTVY